MKKALSLIIVIISIALLTGCFGCKSYDENKCKTNDSCLTVYKPCPEGVFGCRPDGTIFSECLDKE